MGAKNHAVVMPDADKEDTLNALSGAAFGSSGQRCMALPVVILVGDAGKWVDEFVAKAKTLKVGPDVAPVAYRSLLERIEGLIGTAEKQGAKIILDGRKP